MEIGQDKDRLSRLFPLHQNKTLSIVYCSPLQEQVQDSPARDGVGLKVLGMGKSVSPFEFDGELMIPKIWSSYHVTTVCIIQYAGIALTDETRNHYQSPLQQTFLITATL
jgi:hypothetical protein